MEVHSSSGKNAAVGELAIPRNNVTSLRDLSEGDDDSDVDYDNEGNRFKDLLIDEVKSNHKSLNKYATFPRSNNDMFPPDEPTSDEDGDEEPFQLEANFNHMLDLTPTYTRSVSLPPLPSCSDFISAIKGSREKHGSPPKRMNVSWAPEVYDPSPTVLSLLVKGGGKKQQKQSSKAEKSSNKKKDKNKEKGGKESRGGNSKDKKQHRRGSDKGSRSFGDDW